MGTKNKQRRAAKAKRRAKDQARRSGWSGRSDPREAWSARSDEPLFTATERVRGLLEMAARAQAAGDGQFVSEAVTELAAADARIVDRELEGALMSSIGQLWNHGWQPAELVRHARRSDVRAGRLVATAVAADHSRRDPATLHPRWAAQVATLGLPGVDGATGWLAVFTRREGLDRQALVMAGVLAMTVLRGVGPMASLLPPPGADAMPPSSVADLDSKIDDPVLVRVRALLAQAESTTFEAEADAFTAKAQELMARHAIDSAILWARSARDERPAAIRLPIDEPYVDIKSLMLQRVAEHSRCKAVFHPRYAMSSVVGFASDVAATELLFTSLLVQSQSALRAEAVAAKAAPGSRIRSRSFRSSFLMAYAHRIDERLAEINSAVETTAEVEHRRSLVPVLAARDSEVDDVVAEMFGTLDSNVVRGGTDAFGWARGTMAAEQAKLNFGDLDDLDDEDDPYDMPMIASA